MDWLSSHILPLLTATFNPGSLMRKRKLSILIVLLVLCLSNWNQCATFQLFLMYEGFSVIMSMLSYTD